MRLSLSQKEVAEIHLMLTTLPIPPMPVVFTMEYALFEDAEAKAAFEMATSTLVKDSLADDGIVNSHSIFAALSFFAKWSASTGTDPLKKHSDMQLKKDASLLRFIASVLDYNETAATCANTDAKDAAILQLFITASQEWINTYLPENIGITICAAPKNKTIGFEHDLHIAMAHYCYSQGVLYNSKDSILMCKVHDGLYSDFLEQEKHAAEEVGVEKTHEHMEIAAMYSQFPYHKMMQLCFDRLLQDCLYGHKNPNSDGDVQKNARDLLKMSFVNYKAMTNKSAYVEPPQNDACTKDTRNTVIDVTYAVESAVPVPDGVVVVPDGVVVVPDGVVVVPDGVVVVPDGVVVVPELASVASPLPSASETTGEVVSKQSEKALSPYARDAKKSCAADMGSYKSSIGIFILGMANFLQKDDPYFLQNINTSLRHLSELMRHGNEHAKQACRLIDIPRLAELVRFNTKDLSYDNTLAEIQESLLDIEQMHYAFVRLEVTGALEACQATVL